MALTVVNSGTQACTVGSEHTLITVTAAAVYQLGLDLTNLAGGATPDILEVWAYGKLTSGGSELALQPFPGSFVGAQGSKLWFSLPLSAAHSLKCAIKQVQGSGRSIPWALWKHG